MTVWTEHEARDLGAVLSKWYPKKKDKQERAKAVLNDATLGDRLGERDTQFMLGLLAGHPDLTQKVGIGVVGIDVRSALHGTRCFHVLRADGSSTDFSYLKCLAAPTPTQDVRAACRNALTADMALKKAYFLALPEPTCQLTGMPIDADNSHVHHGPPMFDVLVDGWVETVGGYDAVAGNLLNGDNVYGNELCEIDAHAWLRYHNAKAQLLLVHRSANAHIEAARRAIKKAG